MQARYGRGKRLVKCPQSQTGEPDLSRAFRLGPLVAERPPAMRHEQSQRTALETTESELPGFLHEDRGERAVLRERGLRNLRRRFALIDNGLGGRTSGHGGGRPA